MPLRTVENKPFCDGSHSAAGFSSDNGDAKVRNTPVQYTGEVEGKSVTVFYTPVLCGHIAECQRLHKQVFDPSQKPWIQPENGSLEGILAVINACPSGALRVSVDGKDLHHMDSDEQSVSFVKNGPYVVKTYHSTRNSLAQAQVKRNISFADVDSPKTNPFVTEHTTT